MRQGPSPKKPTHVLQKIAEIATNLRTKRAIRQTSMIARAPKGSSRALTTATIWRRATVRRHHYAYGHRVVGRVRITRCRPHREPTAAVGYIVRVRAKIGQVA